jgi:hypothetical protein
MPLFVFGMSIAEALPGQSVANYREPTRQHRVDNQQYDEHFASTSSTTMTIPGPTSVNIQGNAVSQPGDADLLPSRPAFAVIAKNVESLSLSRAGTQRSAPWSAALSHC